MPMKTVSLERIREYLLELNGDEIKYNEWRRPVLIDAIRWTIDQLDVEDLQKVRRMLKDVPEFEGIDQ